MYCNLIQCDHFSDTCIVGEMNGEIVGWVSGYVLPDDPVDAVRLAGGRVGKGARHRAWHLMLTRLAVA